MNWKIIQLCLGYMASACHAFLLSLQLLGQNIFIFCQPRSLLWCWLHPRPFHKYWIITMHSPSTLLWFMFFYPLQFNFPLWETESECFFDGDCPSLVCKAAQCTWLPFCRSISEYLQCESMDIFLKSFSDFPFVLLSSVFLLTHLPLPQYNTTYFPDKINSHFTSQVSPSSSSFLLHNP